MRKKCKVCGEEFEVSANYQKYCITCAVLVSHARSNQSSRVNSKISKFIWDNLPSEEKTKKIELISKKYLYSDTQIFQKKMKEIGENKSWHD